MRDFLFDIAQDKRKGLFSLAAGGALYILSLVYGLLVFFISSLYHLNILFRYKSRIKIISVGNITLGGTGKTPLVEFLSQYFIQNSKKVYVVSRGYSFDETRLLRTNVPGVNILTGRNRIKNIKKIEEEKDSCGIIILDDGFQHWRIRRALDIVTIDSQNPFGNRKLIPRGILREPVSALRRARIIMLTKVNLADNLKEIRDELEAIAPQAGITEAAYEAKYIYDLRSNRRRSPDSLKDEKVCLLSSIGDPQSFKKTAARLMMNLALVLDYPDHYLYQKKDILRIKGLCREKEIETILTTEKDLFRLPRDGFGSEIRLLVLRMGLRIVSNEKEFLDRVSGVFNS